MRIKLFVKMYSGYQYVELLEKEANTWLEEQDGKITILDKQFVTSRNAMYLIIYYQKIS